MAGQDMGGGAATQMKKQVENWSSEFLKDHAQ
jgi:hypothetical protein